MLVRRRGYRTVLWAPDGGGAGTANSGAGNASGQANNNPANQGNANTGNGGGAGSADNTPTGTQTTPTFETWLQGQDDATRQLIEGHTQGLRTALQSERQQRSDLARQLRELAPQAEKGSKLEQQLTQIQSQVEAAERRAQFVEEAIRPEVGCSNPRAAFLVAQAENLFDGRGNPNWEAIKVAAPELFRPKVPASNAGNGTQGTPPQTANMNDFIRRATGR